MPFGCVKELRSEYISTKNLQELEFYDLKVIIKEKPKLISKEKECLEIFRADIYIARDQSGNLWVYDGEPIIPVHSNCVWGKGNVHRDEMLGIDENLFPFITWESRKAWNKEELLELEVMD